MTAVSLSDDEPQRLGGPADEALDAVLDAARDIRARRLPAARIDAARIAEAAGYTLDQLQSSDRHRLVVETRRLVARFLHDERGLSSQEIGDILGRDHSTVLNLLRPKVQGSSRKPTRNPLTTG